MGHSHSQAHPSEPPPPPPSRPQHISAPLPQPYNKPRSNSGASAHPPHSQYGFLHTDTEIHKGLHNETAKFHCFLNVVIQSLWHLQSFRARFVSLDYNHFHQSDPCVFCALRSIFVGFEYSDSSIIPPDALRQALNDGDVKMASNKFRLLTMADAEEALDTILKWLHADQVTKSGDRWSEVHASIPCAPHQCISHRVFGIQSMDVRVCHHCHGTSEPESMESFFYRVYSSELATAIQVANVAGPIHSFEQLLKMLYKQQLYSCPSASVSQCQGKAIIDRWLLSVPLVFAVMLVWPVEAEREQIALIWSIISLTLNLADFLRSDSQSTVPLAFTLRGIVGFYGAHYMSFVYSKTYASWLMFDDRRVVIIGDWHDLCDRVIMGKIRPILIFYEREDPDSQLIVERGDDHRALAATMESDWMKLEHQNPQSQPAPSQSTAPVTAQLSHVSVRVSNESNGSDGDVFAGLQPLDFASPMHRAVGYGTTQRR